MTGIQVVCGIDCRYHVTWYDERISKIFERASRTSVRSSHTLLHVESLCGPVLQRSAALFDSPARGSDAFQGQTCSNYFRLRATMDATNLASKACLMVLGFPHQPNSNVYEVPPVPRMEQARSNYALYADCDLREAGQKM